MPPSIEIYGLTIQRNLITIDSFLERYIIREANEYRPNEELEVREPSSNSSHISTIWHPYEGLTSAIQYGLANSHRSFSLYFPTKYIHITRAILSFTIDANLVLGLSTEESADIIVVKELSKDLARFFGCHLGVAVVEEPPPLNEQLFIKLQQQPSVLHFEAL